MVSKLAQKDKPKPLPATSMQPNTFAQLLSTTGDTPTAFLQRNAHVTLSCRNVLAKAFEDQSETTTSVSAPLGPLSQLHVSDEFSHDQLWHQLELRNKHLLSFLNKRIQSISERKQSEENPSPSASSPTQAPSPAPTPAPDPTSSSKRRVSFAEPPRSVRKHPEKPERHSKKLQASTKSNGNHNISANDTEDGFFSLADMESFADDAEALAEQGKLVLSDENSDAESAGSDGDSDDDNQQQLYADFFDPPEKKSLNADAAATDRAANLLDQVDASSDEEAGEEEEHGDPNADADDDGDDPANMDDDEHEQSNLPEESLTPLGRTRQAERKTMEAIEDASVQPRAWALRGEVSAFSRPKDSLLETEMEHDIAVRPTAYVDTEVSQNIEELIKQRIVDGLFDDVTLAAPEHYRSSDGKEKRGKDDVPEVSQEKPSEGLADLYAREYSEQKADAEKRLKASDTVQREEDAVETEGQREVNKLYEKLSSKLNSLSSLHFTPSADDIQPEVLVKRNVKSIAAEEAVPDGVSDGDMLAPHEVFAVGKGTEKGDIELSKQERKAKRRAHKTRRKKSNEAKLAHEKSVSHFDAVTVDKRRAKDVLEGMNKKPRTATATSMERGADPAHAISALVRGRGLRKGEDGVQDDESGVQAAAQLVL